MQLFGSTKSKTTKDEHDENAPHFEITEVILVYCNIVNNYYQHDSRVLYTSVPNKSFGQFIFLKTFNSEFSYIEVWFPDPNSKPLEIEDKRNIALVINYSVEYKKLRNIQFNLEIEYLSKAMDFCLLLKYGKNIGKIISKIFSDWFVIKLLIELERFQKIHNYIIQRMIKKYLKKDIYFQEKDKKLLII